MSDFYRILAETDGSGHLVWIVLVLLFWGISALASMAKKAAQVSKPVRQAPPPMPGAASARPPAQQAGERAYTMTVPMPPMPARSAPLRRPAPRAHDAASRVAIPPRSQGTASIFAQQKPMQTIARAARAIRKAAAPRQQPPALPPAPTRVAAPTAPPAAPSISTKVTQPISIHRPATANAARLREWLKPATMRQQFILTELLQPPKSMRSEE